jgi:hypothetical protein
VLCVLPDVPASTFITTSTPSIIGWLVQSVFSVIGSCAQITKCTVSGNGAVGLPLQVFRSPIEPQNVLLMVMNAPTPTTFGVTPPATSPCWTAPDRLSVVVAADAKFLLVASAKLTTTVAASNIRLKRLSFPPNQKNRPLS